jgi:hypothetical protein
MVREVAAILTRIGFIDATHPIRVRHIDDHQHRTIQVMVNERFIVDVPLRGTYAAKTDIAACRDWLMLGVVFPQLLPYGY